MHSSTSLLAQATKKKRSQSQYIRTHYYYRDESIDIPIAREETPQVLMNSAAVSPRTSMMLKHKIENANAVIQTEQEIEIADLSEPKAFILPSDVFR